MQICRQMHAVIHCRLILREQTANDNASLEMTHRHVGDAGAFSVCRNISRDSGIRRINLYNDTVTGVLLKYSDPVVGGLELSGFGRRRDRRVFCCSYFHRGASVHAGPRCLGRRTIYSTHTHTHTHTRNNRSRIMTRLAAKPTDRIRGETTTNRNTDK